MLSCLPLGQVLVGDCVEVMREFPAESVDLVVTSPPYWGLRDYGVSGQIGLEEHPQEYIDSLVLVAREIKRILRGGRKFLLESWRYLLFCWC
jgi:DNA modification methylase